MEKRINIKCTGTENVRLDKFKELQGNLKELSKVNYEKLKASILKYGFSFPIFCWKQKDTYWILDAHQRINVLKLLESEGYYIPDLPTVFIEAKDKREAKEKLLQLNSNYGKFTDEGLYEFMNEPNFEIDVNFLREIDLPDIDLEKFELGYFKEQDEEKLNDVPDLREKAVSKLGDLFLIDGKHRVLCGDSTRKADAEALMGGKKANMIFTDPPYNVDYSSKNELLNLYDKGDRIQTDIKNDNFIDPVKYQEFCVKFIEISSEHLAEHNSVYICGNYESLIQFYKLDKLKCSNMLVWVKSSMVIGRMDYQNQHEFIFYGWYGKHKWYGDRKQTTVWNFNKPMKSDLHPTMKPIELIVKAINNSTQQNTIILDLFLGSGSTLIACEQTNRICYGIELDEHYIDVILRRYKKLYPDSKFECLNREFNFNELWQDQK